MSDARQEWQRLAQTFGLCVPVADLKSMAPPLPSSLHIGEYRPFYLRRDQDEIARKHLQEDSGLLIIGRPLSGKTRMALEAMLAVVPEGVLLRFSGPQRLAKLDALVIPPVSIGGEEKKPSLVVFFDDIDRFDGVQFDDLTDRLYPQVSMLYVVATCHSGSVPRVLANASLKNLRAGPLSPSRIVEIRPLTQLQASQIEKEVWKTYPGRDLGLDRTEVGVILRGTKILSSSYGEITPEGKHILRGLFLGECFASPCPENLLLRIVEGVVQNGPFPSFNATLAGLVEADIVQRDDLSRLSIVSHHHRDEVVEAHYLLMSVLRQDLKRIESVLKEKGDATHLTALGVYYCDRLGDLAEAHRVLELSLKLVRHADTLLPLSLVLARSGENDAARAILEEYLRTVSEPERQASLLIRFADELLAKDGSAAAAVPFYKRAQELAQMPATKLAAAFRFGDAFLSTNAFDKAEPIYHELLAKAPDDDDARPVPAARLIVSIVGQGHFQRAAHELREQLRGRPMEFRNSLAASSLENGEGRFLSDNRLSELRKLVWESIRDTTKVETRTADLLAFASDMLFQGFLSTSKIAYSELHATAAGLSLKPDQRTVLLNNLATCHLYLRDPGQARPLFEETLSLLRGVAGTQEYFLAAAEDGIAACDFLEGNLQAAKKRYEDLLQMGKTAGNDTIMVWAHVGLGEIAWKQGNASSAYDHFLAFRSIPNSFDTKVRTALGLARIFLHYLWFDDADINIAQGLLAAGVRVDYAHLRKDFEKLKRQSVDARAALPAMQVAPTGIDALIMKGGGVKGLAFSGAIRELELYFNFDTFVGTSAGAVAAALLAAGATGADLEEKLRRKPFRDFLDGRLRLPFTSWALGGHPGNTFVDWLNKQLHQYVKPGLKADIYMRELPRRAVIYASSPEQDPITFDKDGSYVDIAVHTAVRCSMSIPYFFQPQLLNNRRVYDGGLLNNYPVRIFLEQEGRRSPPRQPKFVALYLGSAKPATRKPASVIADLLSIVVERNEGTVVDDHPDETVVIDTEPIGTIDFDLTEDEKDFLVLLGRAAALEFLSRRGVLEGSRVPTMTTTRAEAEGLRATIKDARRKRRSRRAVIALIIGVVIIALGFSLFWH